MKLKNDFYQRTDVVQIARELLGKELITCIDGQLTSGIITETEAYNGIVDRASHAFGGRFTPRTQTMYAAGGVCYVYLCYGIHHLFNVVTNIEGVPHAILIRNIKPLKGLETILQRRNKIKANKNLSTGPGTLSQAMGIKTFHNGLSLQENTIWMRMLGLRLNRKILMLHPVLALTMQVKMPYFPTVLL